LPVFYCDEDSIPLRVEIKKLLADRNFRSGFNQKGTAGLSLLRDKQIAAGGSL